jgi:hypothetical protein
MFFLAVVEMFVHCGDQIDDLLIIGEYSDHYAKSIVVYNKHHHHHQPINVSTAGAHTFLMDHT